MSNFVTDAINLKAYNLSESDKIILMYSRDKGLIRGVAKGVKKPKSKLGARMDLLVANKLMLYKGKNLDTICQAEALNTFNKIRSNMDKIFYSIYLSEVVSNFGVEDDPCSSEVFDLLYQALDSIAFSETKVQIIVNVLKFQLKMMAISGFAIEFNRCLKCGCEINEEQIPFSNAKGGVICCECNSSQVGTVLMHHKVRDFLKVLEQTDFSEHSDYEVKATEKVCSVCFELLKGYVNIHSPKKFNSTQILQEIC